MVEELTRARLGRGLAALIGDIDDDFRQPDRAVPGARQVPIEFLRRNPHNPRRHFAEPELAELADSIRERGVIQPIVVRPLKGLPDVFEIIAGERRWRAAQRAGLHDVPVVVFEADDRLALELAIIENVQRADLNALEEAAGYEHLTRKHGYSQTELATALGKSRSHVANTLRLLKLPERVRDMLGRNDISAGHARALLAVDDPEGVANRIVQDGLTVRDVETIGRKDDPDKAARPAKGRARPQSGPDVDTRALENALGAALGLTVKIVHRGSDGELRIRYSNVDQLEELACLLRSSSLSSPRPAVAI